MDHSWKHRNILLLITLVLLLPVFLAPPTLARSLYLNESSAFSTSLGLALEKKQTKLLLLYPAESVDDVHLYGRIVDLAEACRGQGIRIFNYAVAKNSFNTAAFLTHAPEWDLRRWLSYPEYEDLRQELKAAGMKVGSLKELPYFALVDSDGNLVRQWQGRDSLPSIHTYLSSIGFSLPPGLAFPGSTGQVIIEKTVPLLTKTISSEAMERKIILNHFVEAGFDRQLKEGGGGSGKLYPLPAADWQEKWFKQIARKNCGNYYVYEINSHYNQLRHYYCIESGEAIHLYAYSKKLELLENFVSSLFSGGRQHVSRDDIIVRVETSGFERDLLMLFSGLQERDYGKAGLENEINKMIVAFRLQDAIGGLLPSNWNSK